VFLWLPARSRQKDLRCTKKRKKQLSLRVKGETRYRANEGKGLSRGGLATYVTRRRLIEHYRVS